ncbi:uncharacterized protein PFL1_06471 [Pseudozyma flocculosa PF-1]|uniref:Related to BOI1 - BEM1 protein-binding protein n=2 Tax=Pseudozyma flocculosa TaxID=84751 RepID=A0A5C3EVA8_9BASI|nr:uncharacterized protein PFL1_06471 [Pseudozyma flocculosa PF-1]EPQ26018.1 hypothetical protein PFL1_06471 [Pseudozyma flocculosa PF-1]SPO35675.1 related to BOI1 - BEM1 protein-binding protein [Pseudozyma flocculosa]
MAGEKVWALHDFEAENPDEVSFKAGECIIVIEKDDAYGDGWWQGTNIRGESGLFPFTYTTLDQSQALVAQTGSSSAEPGTTPQQASNKPGVMHSTMADIDNALTELQSDRRRGRKSIDAPDGSRASFTSERTADMTNDDASEIYNPSSDDYASRSAAARAALAVNAQRDLQSAQEKERQNEQRRREEAMREFEKEEARQRDLLLEKERERQAQAAAGTLDFSRDDKPKVAPIAGVDMSDESDSEGSAGDLDDFGDKTHSPLFGNLASATAQKPSEDAGRAGGSSLKNVVEPLPEETPDEAAAAEDATAAPPASSPAAPAVAAAAADAAEPEIVPPSSAQPEAAPTPAAAPTATADADSSAGPVAAMTAGVGAVALGATAGTITITSRSTSPVPLAHRKADPSTDSKPTDQRSVDESSRGRGSLADESVAGGTGTVGTAATSLAGGGPETPKSTGVPFSTSVQSPSQSVTSGPRPADPTEWTVEQVVDWGRSKGWDENSVLSKFVEHEITGDVLLEMDVNILKEIDIIAFGKRFQVANAIKELRKMVPGAEQLATPAISGMPGSPGGLGVQSAAPFSPTDALMPPQSPHAPAPGPTGPGSWADSQSVKQRVADASYDSSALNGSHSRPASSIGEGVSSNGQAYTGAGGIAAWQAQQASQRSRVPSQNPSEGYSNDDDEPLAALAERQLGAKNRRSTRSNEDTLGALPASPRKRESAGSSSHSRGGGGDRTSFFGIGQRNRKPPPKVMAPGSVAEDERHGKGTLSRLGFARSSRSIPSQAASNSDMKNAISLPTTSPNFDGNGDMARRSRMSAQSGTSTGTAEPKHGRAASVGSAGAGAQPNDWNAAAAGVGPGAANNAAANSEGPVMARIRPVDLEGWMRKKGERYNSWKPRYLALKGSDLVILRDPQAEKIKGYVSMKGYKVIADENTNPGKYGFKILHETEKPHYFSSEDPILVREWMKGLMKATIGRDHSFPVISSYNNATMSLKEAQRMNPPPRPPSPTSRARTQRAKARQNTDQLTARDAAILMNLSGGQPTTPDATGL